MSPEIEVKTLVKRLEKVNDINVLKAIKAILDFGTFTFNRNPNLEPFTGILSEKEANELESIIAEGCENIDDDW